MKTNQVIKLLAKDLPNMLLSVEELHHIPEMSEPMHQEEESESLRRRLN